MELVQAFNAELSTLYEVKPPISKAKMSSITKTAIKAIKMYKHIVQSVERFIAKCRPEYKVPGLYVVDSIVRQSRHQFGHDKDVFGPRFTRNFNQTFQNLFLTCPVDDKPKIVRVLNLWQRNNVFSCDVIQPLLDMANPNADLKQVSSSPLNENLKNDTASQDANIVMHLQQLASTLGLSKNSNGSNISIGNDNQIRFNKKLLDFDYGDDDDDEKGETPTESEPPLSMSMTGTSSEDLNANPLALSMAQNLLSNPELFQKLKQSIAMQSDSMKNELFDNTSSSFFNSNNINHDFTEQLYNLRDSLKLVQNKSNNSSFMKDQNNDFDLNQSKSNSHDKRDGYDKNDSNKDLKSRISSSPSRKYSSKHRESSRCSRKDERISYRNDKSRSDRDRREKRSSRERKSHRSRSRSKSPRMNSTKKDINFQNISSAELKEKERERERRKKGLPNVKKNYVTICSTTLWLGHLPKSTTEVDISDAFGEYGTINTIDLISARGCAYVCMNRRQDAFKALQNLKNLKLHGSHLKMAWAPGKGMKGKEFKDYWDVEVGVSMIPYEKLNADTDFELLEDGSMIDEESMPSSLLEIRNKKLKENKQQNEPVNNTTNPIVSNIPIVSMPSVPNPFSLSIPPGLVPLPPLPVRVGPPMLGPIPSMIPPSSATLLNPNSHPSLIPPPPPPQISCSIKNDDHFKTDVLAQNNNLSKNKSPSQPSIFPPMTLNVPPPNLPSNNKNSIPWMSGVPPPSLNNLPPLQPPFSKEENRNFYPGKDEPLNENMFDPFNVNKSNNNALMPPVLPYDEQNNFHFENMNNSESNRMSQNFGRDNWKRKDQRRDRNNRYNNNNNNSKNNYSDFKNDSRSNYNDNRLNKRKRRDDNFNKSWNNNSIKNNNNNSRNRRRDYQQKSENYSSSNDNEINNQPNQNNVNDDNKNLDDDSNTNKFSMVKNSNKNSDNLNENESNDHNLLKAIET